MANKIRGQQLAQSRPSDTAAVSLYKPEKLHWVEVQKLVVCNTSALATTFRVMHDDNGTTYDKTTSLFWDIPIDPGETVTITENYWMDGATAGNFAVASGTGNALTFTLYGTKDLRKHG
jgi:hypothetical protein